MIAADLNGPQCGRSSRFDAQLLKNMSHMDFDGGPTDEELPGDLRVCEPMAE